MTFIEKTLGGDEKLLMYSQLHWIVPLRGFLWLAIFVVAGWGAYEVIPHWLSFAGPVAIGLMIFAFYLTRYLTTRIGLTDRRLIIRTGLIAVDVHEIDLDDVKAQHVDHGLLGRFLNYGEVHFDARFVGDIPLPDIDHPYVLLRRAHEVCARLSESAYFPAGAPPHTRPAGPPSDDQLRQQTQTQYNKSAHARNAAARER